MISAASLIHQLSDLGTKERIEFAKRVTPTRMKTLGVTMPDVKAFIKEIRPEFRIAPENEKKQFIQELIDANIHEVQLLAFVLLDSEKNFLKTYTANDILLLCKNLDNWVSVDYYGTKITGFAWRNGVISTQQIHNWQKSADSWMRRLALTSSIGLDRNKPKDFNSTPLCYVIWKGAMHEKDKLMVQALSWALRFHISRDRNSVESFLQDFETQLHPRVLREVHKKLDTGLKN